MSTREDLHALLDRLPDTTLPAVARYLAAVELGMPPDITEDDVPLSPEEEAMLAASDEAIARGDIVSHAELGAWIAARLERA
jgi:hypothetical protein